MSLPIVLGDNPRSYIRIDLLPPLQGKFAIHFHLSESLKNAHIKLEYGDTDYCLSLYVFNIDDFYSSKTVRVRSYDLWPKSIMFNASYGEYRDGKVIIKEKRKGYREDAVIVDYGNYSLENKTIHFKFESRNLELKFRIKFYRELRYFSPKYGWSLRSEYLFIPI